QSLPLKPCHSEGARSAENAFLFQDRPDLIPDYLWRGIVRVADRPGRRRRAQALDRLLAGRLLLAVRWVGRAFLRAGRRSAGFADAVQCLVAQPVRFTVLGAGDVVKRHTGETPAQLTGLVVEYAQ